MTPSEQLKAKLIAQIKAKDLEAVPLYDLLTVRNTLAQMNYSTSVDAGRPWSNGND